MPRLEVRRTLIPIANRSEWGQREYTHAVWRHDGRAASVFAADVPADYVRGLLTTYIDETKVPLHDFVTALHAIGLTLQHVEQAIANVAGGS